MRIKPCDFSPERYFVRRLTELQITLKARIAADFIKSIGQMSFDCLSGVAQMDGDLFIGETGQDAVYDSPLDRSQFRGWVQHCHDGANYQGAVTLPRHGTEAPSRRVESALESRPIPASSSFGAVGKARDCRTR